MLLRNIKKFPPNARQQIFERGRQEALEKEKEKELLERLNKLPGGEEKVKETKGMIDLLRNFIGYWEYPKYHMIYRYFIYKQALLKEAEQLVQQGVLDEREDIYYLTFEELRELVGASNLNDPGRMGEQRTKFATSPGCLAQQQTVLVTRQLISKRKEEYKIYEKLTTPG